MLNQRIILSLVVICTLSVLAGQNPSEKQKSGIPEYQPDFEVDKQAVPMQPPNDFQERMNRQMAEQRRNMPDFARLQGLRPEQRIREMQKMAEEQEEQAMKQALEVNEAQWKTIKPKIERVKICREQASVGIGLPFSSKFISSSGSPQGQSFGGSFQYQFSDSSNMETADPSFQNQLNRGQTEGEKICRELLVLLEDSKSSPEAIKQKILELQQARANARKQLVQAQNQLREVLTLRQQARLCLMGLLD